MSAVPGLLLLWALLAGLVALLLARTRYGKHLYAVGTQRTVATLSGVRVHAVLVATYALSGLAASLGGVVILGYTQQVFLSLGDPYTLPSVAAVVVGGTALAGGQGSYWGTVVGAIVLTLLSSLGLGVKGPAPTRWQTDLAAAVAGAIAWLAGSPGWHPRGGAEGQLCSRSNALGGPQ